VSLWKAFESVTWSFGDGTTASGLQVTHTYTKPGVYQLTLTASDTQTFQPFYEHVSTSVTRTVTITALTSPPTSAVAEILASSSPTITKLSESHRVWREGDRLARLTRVAKQPPTGTTFSLSLSELATVSFAFARQAEGRKLKGKCVAQTGKNTNNQPCEREGIGGTLSLTAHKGANRVFFDGRLSRSRTLKPGVYQFTITAKKATGRGSISPPLGFTILE
jgi:PKD repeat protein